MQSIWFCRYNWGHLDSKKMLSSVKSWQWTELANHLRQASDKYLTSG